MKGKNGRVGWSVLVAMVVGFAAAAGCAVGDVDNGPERSSKSLGGQCRAGEGHLFGMNIDPANPKGNPKATALKRRGVRWVRIEFKNQLGFAGYDKKIAQLRNAGVRVLLILDYATVYGRPAKNASRSKWNAFLDKFARRAGAIAAHYGNGVDAWQIWNEPDLGAQPDGYDPYVPPRYYGEMLQRTARKIRAHSSSPIVTGGLASGNPNYLAKAKSATGGLPVDGVAIHPYGQRAPDDWPSANWGVGNMSDLFNAYARFGEPLWITEIGTIDKQRQAQYLKNVYRLANKSGVVHVFWFCWSDGMVPPFGLLGANGGKKASWSAYGSIAPGWGTCPADSGGLPSGGGTSGGSTGSSTTGGSSGGTTSGGTSGTSTTTGGSTSGTTSGGGSGGSSTTGGSSGGTTSGSTSGSSTTGGSSGGGSSGGTSGCPCKSGVDNFCNYGVNVSGCPMTQPGGYCDPNGDGSFDDADWKRGYDEYQTRCGGSSSGGSTTGGTSGGGSTGGTSGCPCKSGVDNYCNYGVNVSGCPMTQPGGYCDPNGDGSFNDADWKRGYNEYQNDCP